MFIYVNREFLEILHDERPDGVHEREPLVGEVQPQDIGLVARIRCFLDVLSEIEQLLLT